MIDRVSPLEFNAFQWFHCARRIMETIPRLNQERVFTLKYEDLIREPEFWLRRIFSFLGVDLPADFFSLMPAVWSDNSQKWPRAFTPEELKAIGPIVSDVLIQWGYEEDERWYRDL